MNAVRRISKGQLSRIKHDIAPVSEVRISSYNINNT
jgi:hypothetical protein